MVTVITADLLRLCLDYKENSGKFTWLVRISTRINIGDEAGCAGDFYWYIRVHGVLYLAHRLAWLWMTGEWPLGQIGHKDLNKFNNSWSNLRLGTPSQHNANKGISTKNKSGIKGVSFDRQTGKWRSQIQVNGKTLTLGRFEDISAAASAYRRAAIDHFGEFSNTGE